MRQYRDPGLTLLTQLIDDNTKYSKPLEELLCSLIRNTTTLPNSMVIDSDGIANEQILSRCWSKGEQKSTGQILALKRLKKAMDYEVIYTTGVFI